MLKESGAKPFSYWKNCWFMITVIFVLSNLTFLASYVLHKTKALRTKPWDYLKNVIEDDLPTVEMPILNKINSDNAAVQKSHRDA